MAGPVDLHLPKVCFMVGFPALYVSSDPSPTPSAADILVPQWANHIIYWQKCPFLALLQQPSIISERVKNRAIHPYVSIITLHFCPSTYLTITAFFYSSSSMGGFPATEGERYRCFTFITWGVGHPSALFPEVVQFQLFE